MYIEGLTPNGSVFCVDRHGCGTRYGNMQVQGRAPVNRGTGKRAGFPKPSMPSQAFYGQAGNSNESCLNLRQGSPVQESHKIAQQITQRCYPSPTKLTKSCTVTDKAFFK
ncbi:hypothetical protein AAFF_G00129980 [Aldrovandia affinis]|uniref:Uncharacterized protein n=1 Tax=Aldrovandia affinis TaxID=143900 RepID=A0AAD7RR81_9TELE|nr:hypothetical protein AAFF_G00129980 [Aldrovandia affinis]